MDQDRSVRKVTDSTAYTIVANGHKLTLRGKLFFSSGPKIDASAMNSTAEILSDSIHTIENLQFLNSDAYNVIIGNTTGVTLNSDFNIDNSLTINSGTSLTINAPHTLTVSGTLTNTAGIAGLVIKSTANGIDGKLVNNSPRCKCHRRACPQRRCQPYRKQDPFFCPACAIYGHRGHYCRCKY